jgi:hypothetical protein
LKIKLKIFLLAKLWRKIKDLIQMLKKNILIIGKKSFLTSCFRKYSNIKKIKIISYKSIEKVDLE